MREFIDVTGKSEDEAIQKALTQLNMDRDDVSVEILERAKSGFLGFGGCPAKVRVYYGPEEETEVPAPRPQPRQEVRQQKPGTPPPAPKPEPPKAPEEPPAPPPKPAPEPAASPKAAPAPAAPGSSPGCSGKSRRPVIPSPITLLRR